MKRLPLLWLTGIFILTVIFGTTYAMAQQLLRISANDPQIQFAEDIAIQLNRGANPTNLINGNVDIANSLAPFVIIYDKSGTILASSGQLNGTPPALPSGVFSHAKPQDRITWQPLDNTRIAAVIQADNNGYVLAGRNIREVEKRENDQLALAGFGWVVSIAAFTSYKVLKPRMYGNGKRRKK